MILSRSAQYALRIMSFFAVYGGSSPLRALDIKQELNIPPFYLSKLLRRLVAAKLLSATKGRGGGFTLARTPQSIRFIDVLLAVEDKAKVPPCVFGFSACADANPCILHTRWKAAKKSFEAWSKETTLGDVQRDASTLSGKKLSATLKKMGCIIDPSR